MTNFNVADYLYLVAFAPAILVAHGFAVRLSRSVELTGRLQGRSTANFFSGCISLLNLILTTAIVGMLDIPFGIDAGAGIIDIVLVGLIGLLLALVLSLIATRIVRALPQRGRAGPNRRANSMLSGLTIGVKVLLALLLLLFAFITVGALVELVAGDYGPLGPIEYLALLALPAFLVFLYFYVRRGQSKASSFRKRLRSTPEGSTDDRPRVLYLRPFHEEHRLFAGTLTLDEFLEVEIARQIGPLIALGNPTDRIAPDGAARQYYEDDEWQAAVEKLATEASCIVAATSASPNTAWELQRVLELGLERHLYLLSPPFREAPAAAATPPDRTGRFRAALGVVRRATFSWLAQDWDDMSRELAFGELPSSLAPAGQTTWEEFVDTLVARGYSVDIPDPGAGAIVGFETGGAAVVLGRGAATPSDFVQPIVDRSKSSELAPQPPM